MFPCEVSLSGEPVDDGLLSFCPLGRCSQNPYATSTGAQSKYEAPTLTKKSTAKITSKTGNTTLLTTVLIWPWALVQVCSTAPATSPEVAKAGMLKVSSRAAVSALARIFL